jgi:NAD-dependent deacetylase
MQALAEARLLVSKARCIAVLTGAGISSESGIPTFRDAMTGLWSRFRPEDLATPEAFARDPRIVWQWYAWRRELVERAQPNAGHAALVELERRTKRFALITQNVDGLHARAGSRRVIELHGNLLRTRCSREGRILEEGAMRPGPPPTCLACGSHARPDVVWFGEMLSRESLSLAGEAARNCDVDRHVFARRTRGLASARGARRGRRADRGESAAHPIEPPRDARARGSSR